jgi:hypothetical protein
MNTMFGILTFGILALNCRDLLLGALVVAIVAPLLAWHVKIFLGLSVYQTIKSHLGPFVYCGKCGTSYAWWNANHDVDHEKVCVCHTHCL